MKKIFLGIFMAAALLFSGSALFVNGGLVKVASAHNRDNFSCCDQGHHRFNWNRNNQCFKLHRQHNYSNSCHRYRIMNWNSNWNNNWNSINWSWNN